MFWWCDSNRDEWHNIGCDRINKQRYNYRDTSIRWFHGFNSELSRNQ